MLERTLRTPHDEEWTVAIDVPLRRPRGTPWTRRRRRRSGPRRRLGHRFIDHVHRPAPTRPVETDAALTRTRIARAASRHPSDPRGHVAPGPWTAAGARGSGARGGPARLQMRRRMVNPAAGGTVALSPVAVGFLAAVAAIGAYVRALTVDPATTLMWTGVVIAALIVLVVAVWPLVRWGVHHLLAIAALGCVWVVRRLTGKPWTITAHCPAPATGPAMDYIWRATGLRAACEQRDTIVAALAAGERPVVPTRE